MPLSPRPARTNLTDRECSKILGAVIGVLVQMAHPNDVLSAVRWWADTPDAWTAIVALANVTREQQEER